MKNVMATYSVHLPGSMAADSNGNSISHADTVYVIYIESASDKIKWTGARKGNHEYSVITTLIPDMSFAAGTDNATNEKIVLHSHTGNKLWKLRLIPSDHSVADRKIPESAFVLEGIYDGKKITQKIDKLIEIIPIPRV